MLLRLALALIPTLLVPAGTLYFTVKPAAIVAIVAIVGSVGACIVAMVTRHKLSAVIGGLVVAFPLVVFAVIASARACNAGNGVCQ